MFKVSEKYRITTGRMASTVDYGNNGAFTWQKQGIDLMFFAIASDGLGWEHVSVHLHSRHAKPRTYTPGWEDMCKVKSLFWGPQDVVMQLHPAESEYVNNQPNTLHLWRPVNGVILTPPSILVGVK